MIFLFFLWCHSQKFLGGQPCGILHQQDPPYSSRVKSTRGFYREPDVLKKKVSYC